MHAQIYFYSIELLALSLLMISLGMVCQSCFYLVFVLSRPFETASFRHWLYSEAHSACGTPPARPTPVPTAPLYVVVFPCQAYQRITESMSGDSRPLDSKAFQRNFLEAFPLMVGPCFCR